MSGTATPASSAASTAARARAAACSRKASRYARRCSATSMWRTIRRAVPRTRGVSATHTLTSTTTTGKGSSGSSSRAGGARRQQLGEHPPQRGHLLVGEEAAEALLEDGGEHRAHVGER